MTQSRFYDIFGVMSFEDLGQGNLGAARALMRIFGGPEAMIASGTHLDDLAEVVYPGPDVDPASIRQLNELAAHMGIAPDGTCADDAELFPVRYVNMREVKDEEPLVEPAAARHWLLHTTKRAIERGDGSIRLRTDQKPDHLGFAAMAIAKGERPKRFSDVYAEVTDNECPLAPNIIRGMAHDMVARYLEAHE